MREIFYALLGGQTLDALNFSFVLSQLNAETV